MQRCITKMKKDREGASCCIAEQVFMCVVLLFVYICTIYLSFTIQIRGIVFLLLQFQLLTAPEKLFIAFLPLHIISSDGPREGSTAGERMQMEEIIHPEVPMCIKERKKDFC